MANERTTAAPEGKSRAKKDEPGAGSPDWSLRRTGDLQILIARPVANLQWLVHGFSTRPGGASEFPKPGTSERPERVLNLGFTNWDQRARVAKNRQEFAAAIAAGRMRMVALRQIHSDLAHRVAPSDVDTRLHGDALLTREPDILLAIQTADCIPILLADQRTHAVAAVHAGWRGTLKRIAEKTLGRMRMEFGTRPEDVVVAIGPGIGACCYEVGHEVAREFAAQFAHARDWFEGPFDSIAGGDNDPNWLPWLTMATPGHAPEPPRVHLNLAAANRDVLAAAGVAAQNIVLCDLCTSCRTDLFFSYRKERQTGRMMAAIGICGGWKGFSQEEAG